MLVLGDMGSGKSMFLNWAGWRWPRGAHARRAQRGHGRIPARHGGRRRRAGGSFFPAQAGGPDAVFDVSRVRNEALKALRMRQVVTFLWSRCPPPRRC